MFVCLMIYNIVVLACMLSKELSSVHEYKEHPIPGAAASSVRMKSNKAAFRSF